MAAFTSLRRRRANRAVWYVPLMSIGPHHRQLHGYCLPLSPSGSSSLLSAPPWHFSGEIIWINYRVRSDAAARFLPIELDSGTDAGSAAAVFAEWQWCSSSRDELQNPAQSQFKEFFLLLSCSHRGQPVVRCPYAWVDKAVPLVRGWIQGMPKRFGSIAVSRAIEAGIAGSSGEVFRGTLAAEDRRLVEGTVTLTGAADGPPRLSRLPLVHTRLFPAWDTRDEPLCELMSSHVTDVEYSSVFTGKASLRFLDGIEADLAALAPVQVDAGFIFSYGETLTGGVRLRRE
jgi:enduracididine biosynthesis enzyme MppR